LAAFKPQSPPKCHGHRKAMVLRQVKKAGPTYGRYFWSCDLPEGRKGDPASRCEDFRWDTRVRGVKGVAAAGKGT
jgi:AP endonuclease-2